MPRDTNEEAAVAAHLLKMDLAGVTVIADAAHTVKANCRGLTQEMGAEYIFFLKGSQFARKTAAVPRLVLRPPSMLHSFE